MKESQDLVVPPQAVEANPPAPEEQVDGVVDMEVKPIEGIRDDCKESKMREWTSVFNSIPIVSTRPAPVAAAVKEMDEVIDNEHESKVREWTSVFNSIPIVSTPPAPVAAAVKEVDEVIDNEHVNVDPIIGMDICFPWDPSFTPMVQSQAGQESNSVGGDGSGSDPSGSNTQEEASTAKLGVDEVFNSVGGDGSGSDPSGSNTQEEASTAKLGVEEADSTTQVVTSTAGGVEVSCPIVFLSLYSFLSLFCLLAHIDLLNCFI